VTKELAKQIYRLTKITTNTEVGWFLRMDDQRVYRIDKARLEKLSDEKLSAVPFSENISVDEVAWKKHHRYFTNVVDVDAKVITWNAKGRKAKVLNKYYECLGQEDCERIQTVSLDGARTYISSTNKYAINALIVLNRFYVVQKINKAIEAVTHVELRKARKNQDEELIALINCKQRFMLIKHKSQRTDQQSTILERLCEINQSIYKGLLLKESFVGVYDLKTEDEAIDYLYYWIDDALDSDLEPFKAIAWSLIDKKM
jgi:transposase